LKILDAVRRVVEELAYLIKEIALRLPNDGGEVAWIAALGEQALCGWAASVPDGVIGQHGAPQAAEKEISGEHWMIVVDLTGRPRLRRFRLQQAKQLQRSRPIELHDGDPNATDGVPAHLGDDNDASSYRAA
jgi:hypothetical protein